MMVGVGGGCEAVMPEQDVGGLCLGSTVRCCVAEHFL